MHERDKKAAEAAKAKTNGTRTATSNGSAKANAGTRAGQKAQTAGSTINDKVKGVSDNLKESIKAQIVSQAVKGAFEDIAAGDFGDIAEQYFGAFEAGMEEFLENTESQLREEIDPKFLLSAGESSSNESTNFLLPTIEVEATSAV